MEKTNFISFHTRQKRNVIHPHILIEDYSVEQLADTKFLGLLIDNNLSWNEHVKFVTKKLSSGLYALRRMRYYCSLKTLKTIYFSLFQSHISYGICIYGGTSRKNLDDILILQKKAIRTMVGLNYNDSVKDYFKELGILTVYSLYILETLKYCKQNNHLSQQLQQQQHGYNTRNHITIQRHNLEIYKKKPSYSGLKLFQYLPPSITGELNNEKFILKTKSYLIELACYSIEEFMEFKNARAS